MTRPAAAEPRSRAAEAGAASAPRRSLLDEVDAVLVGGVAAASLVLATVNVLLRVFAPRHALEWGDEVQVYLVIWAVCLSFGAVTAADRHVKADLFVSMLSPRLRRSAVVLADALGLLMSALLAWYGFLVTYEAWEFGDLSTTTLRFPLWIYYAALPLGAGLMALRYAIRLFLGRRAHAGAEAQA
ncbi:TRAP transporter small permease [Crenalkalicoccus roseus]|uniref:TRAP transporter small permease n=1 Tax=Crenalkalicoccus roseus TaxID=1485588 RepID=UPI0010811B70|nr:TRAP transporter small permease [Crenalkalicoccus roseus]